MRKAILYGLSLGAMAFSASHTQAMPITGAEIFASPNASFPTTQPTLNGSSLVFGPGSTYRFEKLLKYVIAPAGSYPANGPISVSVSVNFTRLACAGVSGGCAGGSIDFDPLFFFGSGTRLFGVVVSDDHLVVPNSGATSTIALNDNGDASLSGSLEEFEVAHNLGFPAIGESDMVNMTLNLTDTTTTVAGTFRSGQTSHTWNEAFSRANGIDFFLLRDNEIGERYQINTVEFILPGSSTPAPEPATLALLGLGLVGLGLSRRKRI